MSKTARDFLFSSGKYSPEDCENWALESIEPERDIEDGIFIIILSFDQKSKVENSGKVKRTETIKVQKFEDERENIVLPD